MTDRDSFPALRDQVIALLERSAEVMERVVPLLGDDGEGALPQNLRERANKVRDEEFVVVVVGEIKRGKSMLLNALMRQRLLPMDALECTATVNFLRYPNPEAGQSPETAVVHYVDGRPQEHVPVDNLKDYVSRLSADGRDAVATSVDHVDVFVESPFLEKQVLLVDTPGTNTTTANHMRITYDQIDRSSAAIFLLDVDTQVTRSDREFLRHVEDAVARLFFVVNKIDRKTEDEIRRSLDDVEQKVKGAVSDGSKLREHAVCGVSAMKGFLARCGHVANTIPVTPDQLRDPRRVDTLLLESRIEAFERDLQDYLFRGEKGSDLLRSPFSFIRTHTDLAVSYLNRQTAVLDDRFDVAAHERDIEKMQRRIDAHKHELAAATDDLSEELSTALSTVEKALAERCELAEEELRDLLNAYDSVETLKQDWSDGLHIATLPGRKAAELGRYGTKSMKEAVDGALRKASRAVRKQIRDELGELSVELPTLPELSLQVREPESRSDEVDEIKKRIEDTDRRLQELEPKTVGANEGEYRRLESELQREREEYHFQLQQLGSRPEIRITERTVVDHKWREGLVGIIGTVLIGRKETEHVEEVRDDEERREHDESREDLRKQHEEKIADIERRVREARGKLSDEMVDRKRAENLEKVRVNYQRTLDKEETRHRKAVADERTRAVEVTKNRVIRVFRDAMQRVKDVVGDSIGKTGNMAAVFIAEVSEALDEGLKTEEKELEKLRSLKEQTVGEREKTRRKIEGSLQELSALQGDASQLMKQHTNFIRETGHADAEGVREVER